VFELGVVNDLGIYSKWYAFGVKRSKVKVTGSVSHFACQNRDSSTFTRWRNQSLAWDRTL